MRRRTTWTKPSKSTYFNPRTPRGVRQGHHWQTVSPLGFQSTHPARGATGRQIDFKIPSSISIHAPREGCDGRRHCGAWASSNFNPRTPRGVRQGGGNSLRPLFLFQSTHPARGATPAALPGADQPGISIHAPREGCDLSQFVDTTSRAISIHAPREGCDAVYAGTHRCHMNFNPRTPRGVRRYLGKSATALELFQSTHPARGATGLPCALCESGRAFQSTHPARGATGCYCHARVAGVFQSTHPARGATANFTKEQRVCLAQFAYLHKGKKAEHTKTNAPMLH